jgi:hypothetical protein
MTASNQGKDAPQSAPAENPKRKKCKYTGCRKLFTPRRDWQLFCKPECKNLYHQYGSAFGDLTQRGTKKLVKVAQTEIVKLLPKLTKKFLADQARVIEALERRIGRLESDAAQGCTMSHLEGATKTMGLLVSHLEARVKMLEGR